jgi:hypothetical protein
LAQYKVTVTASQAGEYGYKVRRSVRPGTHTNTWTVGSYHDLNIAVQEEISDAMVNGRKITINLDFGG